MSFLRRSSECAAIAAIATFSVAAAADPQVKTRISTNRPEVGEPYTVQLSALVSPGEPIPADPVLKAPKGATIVGGPNVGQSMVMINGITQVGIDTTWQLVSNAPGRVKIPAPTVLWAGKRFSGQAVEVEVVPSSGRPRRSTNPFLLPGGPGLGGFGSMFGFDRFGPFEEEPPALDEKLAMATAPDPYVFLHATIDKKNVVVGEQIIATYYLYYRVNATRDDLHYASNADFLRWSLLSDPGVERTTDSRAKAGSHIYNVKLLDRVALFPLRTGDLHLGQMQYVLSGREIGRKATRSSEDLVVRVSEPPRVGRPAGYVLGDVGRFAMTASVEPRRIPFGGTLAVTAKISGNGNFPQALSVPERTGVEWLDPEKKESIGPQGNIISGFRSFGYVVRVKESGTVDLGKIELPHWDPAIRKYQVASVALGSIEVLPPAPDTTPAPTNSASASNDATNPTQADPFIGLASARSSLGAYSPAPAPILDGVRLYAAFAAPPIAYVFFSAAAASARRLKQRREQGAVSPERLANAALDDAKQAQSSGDIKAVCGAIERALHHAIKAATDLESRGILLNDLAAELEDAGLSEDLAESIESLFEEVSALRFAPDASDKSIEEVLQRGRSLVQELLRNPVRDRG